MLTALRALLPKRLKKFLRPYAQRYFPSIKFYIEDLEAEKNQIRVRTEDELNQQAVGLREIRNVFNSLSIEYFLSGGTLLGIVREGDFIKWDWDIGIDVRVEDILSKEQAFLKQLSASGFEIVTHYSTPTNFKINAVKYDVRYEVAGLIKVGDKRFRKAYNYPDELVQKTSVVTLRNEKYTTFYNPELYLGWLYGDWRTPIRTVDKGAYVTAASRTTAWNRFVANVVSKFH